MGRDDANVEVVELDALQTTPFPPANDNLNSSEHGFVGPSSVPLEDDNLAFVERSRLVNGIALAPIDGGFGAWSFVCSTSELPLIHLITVLYMLARCRLLGGGYGVGFPHRLWCHSRQVYGRSRTGLCSARVISTASYWSSIVRDHVLCRSAVLDFKCGSDTS